MTALSISLSFVGPSPLPSPPAGLYHIAEIMPHVLDRYGLSLDQEPDSVPPAKAREATDVFDVTISCLESALAG
jgi:hypothetical protein